MKTLLFFTLLMSISTFDQQRENVVDFINEGVYYYDNGQYERALKMYDKALAIDSGYFPAIYEKGMTLYALHRYSEAIDYSKKAINAGKKDKDALENAYILYGNTLDESGKPQEALNAYNKGLKKKPESYLLNFNKGVALSRLGRYDEALASLWKAVTLNPNHPGSHSLIGKIEIIRNNRIPAAMALARFFTLEQRGARAEENLRRLKAIVDSWVVRKDENTFSINVYVTPKTIKGKKKKDNDFSIMDMSLPIAIAGKAMKERNNENDIIQFIDRFELFCSIINGSLKDNSGFYWKYYVPYFAQMSEKEFSGTLARIVFVSTGDISIIEWLNFNKELVNDFFKWSQDFPWNNK